MEYMKYHRNNKEKPITIYRTSNDHAALFHTIYNKKLYIAEVSEELDNDIIKVLEIDEEGNENHIDTYDRSTIRCIEGFDDCLNYINQRLINNLPLKELNGKINQDYERKIVELYYRDKTQVPINKINGEKASSFIESDCVTSDNLYYLNGDDITSVITIPGVEEDENISDYHRLSRNMIMFNNTENIYVYNLSNHMYFEIEYNQFDNINEICQSPIYNQNKIGYMVNRTDTNEMFFYEITLDTYY
jgi:hypothetical protein